MLLKTSAQAKAADMPIPAKTSALETAIVRALETIGLEKAIVRQTNALGTNALGTTALETASHFEEKIAHLNLTSHFEEKIARLNLTLSQML